MIILTVQNLQKAYGTDEVLKDVSMTLQNGQRMGLVGVNGCGKTTLLRILSGQLHYDGGSFSLNKGLKLGYLEQQSTVKEGNTVLQELEDVYLPVREMEQKLRRMEESMALAQDQQTLERLGAEYERLQHRFEEEDGYSWPSLVQGALLGMGFPREQWGQAAATLSGGELTRLCLAKLLLQKPDLLLLDEPTNHLDLAALNWLEKYLIAYKGAVIVVSHDRYFLDRVCTNMTEILLGVSEQYEGNYSRYMELRTERFEARMKAYELQQAEIERQEKVIAKLRSFNREKSIKRAESRQKALDKVERLDKPMEEKQVNFSFGANRKTGEDVLFVKDFEKSYDGRRLFDHVELKMYAGDRIALIGRNGIGKSTLLKCLIGEETPDWGTVRWGANVDLGYYDQQQKTLHPEKTVLREVWDDFVRLDQTQVRSALGLFLFTGDDVFAPVSTLSGGEKGRVALTKLMLRRDNVLLLDEPTNHLDMDSREVLEDALEDFPGTILAVSHDRYFINRFANKVAVLDEHGIEIFQGNYDDYMAMLEKRRMGTEADDAFSGMTRTEAGKEKRRQRMAKEQLKALKNAVKAAEEKVLLCEEAVAAHEEIMADPATYLDPTGAEAASRKYQELKDALSDAYAAWEEAEEALAEAEE
ncbi:MAG: ABC-F family ATP-binding cassette domain-containing protein [Clostridiales bacterium]|nr:ABC-F family ATP-binding cassette domain-containing protein [Clostridiales bacterium]